MSDTGVASSASGAAAGNGVWLGCAATLSGASIGKRASGAVPATADVSRASDEAEKCGVRRRNPAAGASASVRLESAQHSTACLLDTKSFPLREWRLRECRR